MSGITESMALVALKAGLEKAAELGEPSSVSIVDAGGNLIAFARSDGAPFGVGDIAINKAYTSAAFQCRTEELYEDAQPGGDTYGVEVTGNTRPYVLFGGGIPIMRDGVCVGAVGVSGGPVSADLQISAAMAETLQG
ncbi:MAG: heme-binding protein [Pseudomonadota bacterium]